MQYNCTLNINKQLPIHVASLTHSQSNLLVKVLIIRCYITYLQLAKLYIVKFNKYIHIAITSAV